MFKSNKKYYGFLFPLTQFVWVLSLLTISAVAGKGQNQSLPVSAQLVASPPYSTFLPEYQTGSNLLLTLIQRDLALHNLRVYLNIELEGAGVRLRTLPAFRPSSFILLDPGVPVTLSNPDLAEYFNLSGLSVEGMGRESFLGTGQQLPQGLYKLKVQAFNALNGLAVSNQAMALMGIYKGQAPIINLPFHNKVVPANDLQTFTIQWTNRNSGAFNAANTPGYRLQVWELPETSLDPNVVVNSNYPPILEEYLTATTYQYGPTDPALIPGRSYAIRVQAVDAAGRDLFVNDGYSQVVRFLYGGACVSPSNVAAKTLGSTITLSWTGSGTKGYTVKYWRADRTDTSFADVLLNTYTLRDLPPSALYYFQVASLCDGEKLSAYSKPLQVFTLPEGGNNMANCGARAPKVNLDNQDPLPFLKVGDVFRAYDFEVRVTGVGPSNAAGFVGEGVTEVKMLGNLNTVVTFEGIKINTDYQLIEGRVDFQQKPYVFSDERLDRFRDDFEASTRSHSETVVATPKDISIQGTISGIALSGDGKTNTVTYTDGSGHTHTTELATGKDYRVVDKTGDTYLITKDGSVAKQGKATAQEVKDGPAGPGGQNTVLFFRDSSLVVSFKAHSHQKLGFDTKGMNSSVSPYGQIRKGDGGNYDVAWKSVPAGGTDVVKASVSANPANVPVGDIKFKTSGGQAVRADYDDVAKEWNLTIQGSLHRQDFAIYPYYEKAGKEIICGKLDVMPLDRKAVHLVLVPLKGFNTAAVKTGDIESYLGRVYPVANTEVKVSLAQAFDHPAASLPLATEHGKLADYSANQSNVILAYQQTHGEPADNTLYLFLSPQASPSGSGIRGHTPVNRSYGFLFNAPDHRTIAHELGHGYPLALEHPFLDATMSRDLDNLMSYGSSTQLGFAQWASIHQPPVKIRTGQADKEGMYIEEKHVQEVARFINQIRCGIIKGAGTAVLHFGYLKYEGVKVAAVQKELGINNTVAAPSFNNATISVYINAGHGATELVEGYRDLTIQLPGKTYSPQKGLSLTATKGTINFVVTAADQVAQEQAYSWLLRETGLDGKRQYQNITVNNARAWKAEEMFFFSECELEKLSRTNREKLIASLLDNLENLIGRNKHTFQYLMLKALKTIPAVDKSHFYDYFLKNPKSVHTLLSKLDDEKTPEAAMLLFGLFESKKYTQSAIGSDQLYYWFTRSDDCRKEGPLNLDCKIQEDGSITLQQNYIFESICKPVIAKETISGKASSYNPMNPVGMVFLRKPDPSKYQSWEANKLYLLPAFMVKYVVDEQWMGIWKNTAKNTGELALLSVGIGEFTRASTTMKLVVALDAAVTSTDLVISNPVIQSKFNQTQNGQVFLWYWKQATIATNVLVFSPFALKWLQGSVEKYRAWRELKGNIDDLGEEGKKIEKAIGEIEVKLGKAGGIPTAKWYLDLPAGLKADIGNVDSELGKLFANASEENRKGLVDAWKVIQYNGDNALVHLRTNLTELDLVSKNLYKINEVGGYKIWKTNLTGKFTSKQIEDYAYLATKQNDKSKVMLGMWDGGGSSSYIYKAGNQYTYFDFGNKWDEAYEIVNRNDDEIWRINKKFIDNQRSAGKEFWFSHDPFSPKNEQFFAREVNYLIDKLGVKDFKKVGDLWKAIW